MLSLEGNHNMYYLIGAILLSGMMYWILQGREDEKAKSEDRPPASGAKRVMLFFFLLIVMTFVFFFIGNALGASGGAIGRMKSESIVPKQGGGGVGVSDYRAEMVKHIKEDVIVGLPPFGAFSADE
jgi:hypothetical protein